MPGRSVERLVRRWLDDLHAHVTLVYPWADTDATLRAAFETAAAGAHQGAPGQRAWLYRLAREAVYDGAATAGELQRRNADAVLLGLRDAASELSGEPGGDADRTLTALALLPVEQQEILRLCTVADLEAAELGWVLGMEPDAATEALIAAAEALESAANSLSADEGGDHDG